MEDGGRSQTAWNDAGAAPAVDADRHGQRSGDQATQEGREGSRPDHRIRTDDGARAAFRPNREAMRMAFAMLFDEFFYLQLHLQTWLVNC